MQTNENVMQKAEKLLEFWEENSLWCRIIQRDIDANDLEALAFHVKEATNEQEMIEKADLWASHITNWLVTGNPKERS